MGDKRPPSHDFENSSENYFTSIPSDKGLGTQNPRSLGIQTIFAILRVLEFTSSCGLVDKIPGHHEVSYAFESRAQTVFFIFKPENILRSNLTFSTCYGRLTDLKSFK